MIRGLIGLLLLLTLGLQYRLWVGNGSLAQIASLEKQIAQQTEENERILQRNLVLAREVDELKAGLDGVEARARSELGMIKEGETFYLLIDKDRLPPSRTPSN